jgi:DNA repair exonuclease SbcCD ATPase subunit
MHPIKLQISNFCQYDENQVVDFSKYTDSVCAVTALNRDDMGSNSNAAGKSNLFDSIIWCLFDNVPRKVGADEVIRYGEKSCSVVFSFEHNKKVYEVSNYRDRNKSEYYFTVDGVKVEYKKKADTIKDLSNHIGMDYDLYLNVVYLSQNGEKALLSSDPKERINLISKLLNINFDKQLKQVKEDIKKQESDVLDCESLLKGIDFTEDKRTVKQLDGEIEVANKETDIIKNTVGNIEKTLKLYDNDKLELEKQENFNKELNRLTLQIDEYKKEIVKLENDKKEAEESLNKERKNEFELMIKNRGMDKASLEQEHYELLQKKEKQFKEINEYLNKKEQILKDRDLLIKDLARHGGVIDSLEKNLNSIMQKCGEINARISN